MENKTFLVEKKGKRQWVVIRQSAHDPKYKIGSHIPSYGKVLEVRDFAKEQRDFVKAFTPNRFGEYA